MLVLGTYSIEEVFRCLLLLKIGTVNMYLEVLLLACAQQVLASISVIALYGPRYLSRTSHVNSSPYFAIPEEHPGQPVGGLFAQHASPRH